MKRIIVGLSFLLSGTIMNCTLIKEVSNYYPDVAAWNGSRFWYTLFNVMDSSVYFFISVLLICIGLIILIKEYLKK